MQEWESLRWIELCATCRLLRLVLVRSGMPRDPAAQVFWSGVLLLQLLQEPVWTGTRGLPERPLHWCVHLQSGRGPLLRMSNAVTGADAANAARQNRIELNDRRHSEQEHYVQTKRETRK